MNGLYYEKLKQEKKGTKRNKGQGILAAAAQSVIVREFKLAFTLGPEI